MKIIVAEDHPLFREAIQRLCVERLGHRVVATTGSGPEAAALAIRCRPDVMILDLGLPGLDGFGVVRRVRAEAPTVRFLAFTSHLDPATVYLTERAGLEGFLDKEATEESRLREALVALAAGRRYFCPAYLALRQQRLDNPRSFDKCLTDAEWRILELVGCGLDDDEIAARLGRSAYTAQKHRSRIMAKLGIPGAAKLVAYLRRQGFGRFVEP